MTKTLVKITSIILVLLLIYGCAPSNTPPIPTSTYLPTPLPEDLRIQIRDEYLAAIDPLLSEWEETIETAKERRLYGAIENLSRLRDEFARMEIDPYFANLHAQMILHMDCQIASHLALIDPQDYHKFDPEADYELLFSRCSYPFQY